MDGSTLNGHVLGLKYDVGLMDGSTLNGHVLGLKYDVGLMVIGY